MAVLSWWSDLSVNSVNERDPCLLNSSADQYLISESFLEGRPSTRRRKIGAITGL